ncbi:hypothetical protein GCWU000323_01476 [Leptotrichia hofstadii F0254]|uniref:Uncharacterized protein n=1 Tax=Leptotrichia hofstadii F0254 TaxID=634994 RepID=C9MY54_9FUSO|nr:hypothetical protein GCWU000323_01476 [Leptotrichia hofstadii F0254]
MIFSAYNDNKKDGEKKMRKASNLLACKLKHYKKRTMNRRGNCDKKAR